eukprot:TRINITY_DN2956_c0_g1_i2.p1 TRINITY_DN2956_c0_g1~~TRINITY_DN2956_c0_g1_i2.p1  ORF type:complete len:380 (+),score=-0.72 TRINITY_DN2956_c0_g1_i2:94-1233(+)
MGSMEKKTRDPIRWDARCVAILIILACIGVLFYVFVITPRAPPKPERSNANRASKPAAAASHLAGKKAAPQRQKLSRSLPESSVLGATASEFKSRLFSSECDKALNTTLSLSWASTVSSALVKPPSASKRVAICLSGEFRTFGKIYAEIEATLVRSNDADVFLYASLPAEFFDTAQAMLSKLPWVKAYRLEASKPDLMGALVKESCTRKHPQLAGHLTMFRKVYLCDELVRDYERQHGFEYQVLVRSRPDLLLAAGSVSLRHCPSGKLCVHQQANAPTPAAFQQKHGFLPTCSDENKAVTPGCAECCPFVSASFAFGDRSVMQRYAQIFFWLTSFQPWGTDANWREHFVFQALDRLGLHDAILPVGVDWLGGLEPKIIH